MIDLYYWPTPNGHKITMFLEETAMPYTIVPVNIGAGEQFKAAFLAIAPNNRMPAIVDHSPLERGAPISVFESGAILLYLADKSEQFIPNESRGRVEVLQWLFWQMGGLGPMLGQNHHFSQLCARENSLRHRSLREGNQPPVRRLEQAACRPRFCCGHVFHCRHGVLSVDRSLRGAGAKARGFPAPAALVRSHQGAPGDGACL